MASVWGGEGWGAFVVSIMYVLVVQWGGGLLRRWWGISGRSISKASSASYCLRVYGLAIRVWGLGFSN